jgi:Beta-glucosidase-related glycosidases
MKQLVLSILLLSLWSCSSVEQKKSYNQPLLTTEIQKKVDNIYDRMTVEERVAQITGIRSSQLVSNGKLSIEKCREKIPHGIGHVCQFACALDMNPNELRDFVRDLQSYLMNETPSGIPAIFHEEAITGLAAKGATIYPQQLGIACTWNPDLARLKTAQTATTMRAVGATMALSPMVDLIRNAHWPRIEESYGEDAYLSAVMGSAFVEGLQGGDLRKGVAACTKHFLGYGGGSTLSWKEIYEEILFPHEASIQQTGSKVVMTSYGKFKSKQAVSSDTLLNIILKDYLEFDGIVVSDYGAVGHSSQKGNPDILKIRAAEAINAGNDIEFPGDNCYKFLPELLRERLVSEERFAEAVKKSLALKVQLGLLDENPKLYETGDLNLDAPENRKTSYELACQSIVMLKNDGTLPLSVENKKIALVGPNANTFWCMLGDYTYQSMQAFWWGGKIDPNNPKIVPLRESLAHKLGANATLGYERGCDWSSTDEVSIIRGGDPRTERLKLMLMQSSDSTNWDKAIQLATGSDIIIAALGENPTLSGEARERKGIRLPGDQERFLQELIQTGKPVVLVIFGGRPQVINSVEEGCAAILQAWYPGEEGGNAVADILMGNVNPSGKLSLSYPVTESQELYCYNNGHNSERVAYPFGYGLSYTTFEYSDIKVPATANTTEKYINVSCKVKNTGTVEGTEIVQLYLSPDSSQPLKPIQLKGFARVNLKPGETKSVTFKISPQQMAYYSNGTWITDAGAYNLKIGASATDIRLHSTCQLKGNAVVMKHRDILFSLND